MKQKIIAILSAIIVILGGSAVLYGARTTAYKETVITIPLAFTATGTTVVANYSPIGNYFASQDLLCEPPILDVKTAIGNFASNISMGTTTMAVSSSSLYYTVTSTKTLFNTTFVATTTAGYTIPGLGSGLTGIQGTWFNVQSPTSGIPWKLSDGEVISVYADYGDATSTASYTATNGHTFDAKVKIKCLTY